MLSTVRSDLYNKLAITAIDYSSPEWGSRTLLGKACKESPEPLRLYATKFLGVLLRSKTPNFAQWGIDLLVNQLYDKSKVIPWIALDILHEACDDKMNLEAVICAFSSREPIIDHLGVKGIYLLIQFISSSNGFKFLQQTNMLNKQLQLWAEKLNVKYVASIDELLNDGLTRHQRNDEREYGRRSHESHATRDCFIPPHLYGQLALNNDGLKMLKAETAFRDMIMLIKETEKDVVIPAENLISLRAAIWAVCHVSAAPEGAKWMTEENVILSIISLAESSPQFSVRATCFYALSLVAMTKSGTSLLSSRGWCSLHYGKDERWPVAEELFLAQLERMEPLWEEKEFLSKNPNIASPEDSSINVDEDNVDSTKESSFLNESSSSQSSSISRRKRLNKMFRSFSLGNSSEKLRLSLRRKKKMFQNTSLDEETQPTLDTMKISSKTTTTDRDTGQAPKELNVISAEITSPMTQEDSTEDPLTNIDEELVIASADLDELAAKDINLYGPDFSFCKQESFTDSTSGISSEGSLQMPKMGFSVMEQAKPKLSPIASATSINTMKSPQNPSVAASHKATEEEKESSATLRSRTVTRSGQRALSESEAANVNYLSVSSGYKTSQIHISATSVSSSQGSWTDNPGYQTLRSIHNRRRPPLISDTTEHGEATSDNVMKTTTGLRAGRSNTWSKKTNSLDYRLKRASRGYSSLPRRDDFLKRMKPKIMLPLHEEGSGQERRFWGITLPLILDRLFPVEPCELPANGGN